MNPENETPNPEPQDNPQIIENSSSSEQSAPEQEATQIIENEATNPVEAPAVEPPVPAEEPVDKKKKKEKKKKENKKKEKKAKEAQVGDGDSETKKKSKTGLWIGIIVAVLLLGGGATWYFLGMPGLGGNGGGGGGGGNAGGEGESGGADSTATAPAYTKASLAMLRASDSNDFNNLLNRSIQNRVKDLFPDNYWRQSEIFSRDVMDYNADWNDWQFKVDKVMEPDTMIFTEKSLYLDFGNKLTSDASKHIELLMDYNVLIPFLNADALKFVPAEQVEAFKKNVSELSQERVEELIGMVDYYNLYDKNYLNGFSTSMHNVQYLSSLSDNFICQEGEGLWNDDSYSLNNFYILSQNENEATVKLVYRTYSTYDYSSYDQTMIANLVKEPVTLPSGLTVDMWLIDDVSEDSWVKGIPGKEYPAEYITRLYDRVKGAGGPEMLWMEISEYCYDSSHKPKFIADVNKFVSEFARIYPDGVAK